jgi:uncharacterized phiE125 gp8 family phage protein
MWYPAKITVSPSAEPISATEAKAHLMVDFADDDSELDLLIKSARDHAERYCGTRFATQTVEVACDSFADFERLSEAPVQSISSIKYIDTEGVEQTLDAAVYELRADGMDPSIALKAGQRWPSVQAGSRIKLVAIVGYDVVPPAVKHAILLFIGGGYADRENTKQDGWSVFDSLLCNYRRNA